uniref:Histone acetyltransferase n=1 Tax=Panagrellus redivivus TaxID=6233 RepID=A0A7E4VXY7_PANRE
MSPAFRKPLCGWKKRACRRKRIIGNQHCELHSNSKPRICPYNDFTTKIPCRYLISNPNAAYCYHHTLLVKRQLLEHKEFVEVRSKGKRVKDALETKSFPQENSLFHNRQRYVDQYLSRESPRDVVPSIVSSKELRQFSVQAKAEFIQHANQLSENVNLRHKAVAKRMLKLAANVKQPYQLANPESVNSAVNAAVGMHLAKDVKPIPKISKDQALEVMKPIEIPSLKEWRSGDPVDPCSYRYLTRLTPSCVVNVDYDKKESDSEAVDFVMDYMLFMVENDGVPEQAYKWNLCNNSRVFSRVYCWNHLYNDKRTCLQKCLYCRQTARPDVQMCRTCFNKKLRLKMDGCLKDSSWIPGSKRIAIGEHDDDAKRLFEAKKKFEADSSASEGSSEAEESSSESEAEADKKEGAVDRVNGANKDRPVPGDSPSRYIFANSNRRYLESLAQMSDTESSDDDESDEEDKAKSGDSVKDGDKNKVNGSAEQDVDMADASDKSKDADKPDKVKEAVQPPPLIKPDPWDKTAWRYCPIPKSHPRIRGTKPAKVAASTTITSAPPRKIPFNVLLPRISLEEHELALREEEDDTQRSKKAFNPLPDRCGLLKPTEKTLQFVDVAKDSTFKNAPQPPITYLIAARDTTQLPTPNVRQAPRPRRLLPLNQPYAIYRPVYHGNAIPQPSRYPVSRFRATVPADQNPNRPVFIDTAGQQMRHRYRMVTLSPSLIAQGHPSIAGNPLGNNGLQNPSK